MYIYIYIYIMYITIIIYIYYITIVIKIVYNTNITDKIMQNIYNSSMCLFYTYGIFASIALLTT